MIGRPAPGEAASYYFKYIDQVPGEDPIAALREQPAEWQRLFASISEERSTHRYAPDKWSIRQVVNHIADCERLFAFRAFWFARGFETSLPSFDQDVAARGADADARSWASHVEDLRNARASTLSLFTSLPDEAWTRQGIASDVRFTVRAFAWIAAGHATHHVRILRERYLT